MASKPNALATPTKQEKLVFRSPVDAAVLSLCNLYLGWRPGGLLGNTHCFAHRLLKLEALARRVLFRAFSPGHLRVRLTLPFAGTPKLCLRISAPICKLPRTLSWQV